LFSFRDRIVFDHGNLQTSNRLIKARFGAFAACRESNWRRSALFADRQRHGIFSPKFPPQQIGAHWWPLDGPVAGSGRQFPHPLATAAPTIADLGRTPIHISD
jgi:hypothetical protein